MLSDDISELMMSLLGSLERHGYSFRYGTELLEVLANLYKVVYDLDVGADPAARSFDECLSIMLDIWNESFNASLASNG